MSTADIANTLLSLQPATLQEMLEHVGILISCKAQHVMGKTEMIKMFEDSIIEIGIEYLLAKCNNEVINKMAIKLGVPSRKGIVERIRWLGIPSFLQLVDDRILSYLILQFITHITSLLFLLRYFIIIYCLNSYTLLCFFYLFTFLSFTFIILSFI